MSMYVFILNGDFDRLLDMSFEDAEQYAIRRLVACGETPYYRRFYEDVKDEVNDILHFVIYGCYRDGKHTTQSSLRCVAPRTVDNYLKAGVHKESLAIWQTFIADANNSENDYHEIEENIIS